MKRQIIKIDDNKCTGCGLCVPDCPEGAIQIINGKARLISDLFCDGLGACIGGCPEGAIDIEEREAEPYNETLVMENIIKQGDDVIAAHLKHLKDHNETGYLNEAHEVLKQKGIKLKAEPVFVQAQSHGCPGSMNRVIQRDNSGQAPRRGNFSRLAQWPVKLKLLNPFSSLFTGKGVNLLVSADCTPYAHGNFHDEFIDGRVMVTFCPKLDPYIDEYREKLETIFREHDINSIMITRMEVPCCGGVSALVKEAIAKSGKNIRLEETVIKI